MIAKKRRIFFSSSSTYPIQRALISLFHKPPILSKRWEANKKILTKEKKKRNKHNLFISGTTSRLSPPRSWSNAACPDTVSGYDHYLTSPQGRGSFAAHISHGLEDAYVSSNVEEKWVNWCSWQRNSDHVLQAQEAGQENSAWAEQKTAWESCGTTSSLPKPCDGLSSLQSTCWHPVSGHGGGTPKHLSSRVLRGVRVLSPYTYTRTSRSPSCYLTPSISPYHATTLKAYKWLLSIIEEISSLCPTAGLLFVAFMMPNYWE